MNTGEIINKLREVGISFDAMVMNARAYTHTSVGIGDVISGIGSSVIVVHVSKLLILHCPPLS